MEELIKKIIDTGYIADKKIGMYFHIKYPDLFKQIYEATKSIETTYRVNKTLRSRVIFLLKYKNNLDSIKNGKKWMTFDRKIDDFICKSLNSAKTGWDKKTININQVKILSIDETIKKLKSLKEDDIYGKSTNRKMMVNDPILFKSIYHYSSELELLNKPTKTFPARIQFIRYLKSDIKKLKCGECKNNYCMFNSEKKQFNILCRNCFFKRAHRYPQKEWFKEKYGKDWKIEYKKDRDKIKDIKVNSEKWFAQKYGDNAVSMRNKYISSQIERIINIKTKRVSKISQELFWTIYNNLEQKDNCFFSELNKEIFINANGQIYFPDFVYKNKIIEYDGKYWHNNIKDEKRNYFYDKLNYRLLIINSEEYNRKKKPKEVIEKCLKFLLDEN